VVASGAFPLTLPGALSDFPPPPGPLFPPPPLSSSLLSLLKNLLSLVASYTFPLDEGSRAVLGLTWERPTDGPKSFIGLELTNERTNC